MQKNGTELIKDSNPYRIKFINRCRLDVRFLVYIDLLLSSILKDE